MRVFRSKRMRLNGVGALMIFIFAAAVCAQPNAGEVRTSDHCRQVSLSDLRDASECQPRIVQNNIEATVATLRAGRQVFSNPRSTGDTDNRCQTFEHNGRFHHTRMCECELKVQHVRFAGSPAGLEKINRIEQDDAASYRCSDDMASVDRTIAAVSTSLGLVSVLIQQLFYCHSCGGSCQGSFQFTTYDTQTANEYVLSDVVETADFSRLRDRLAEDFMVRYGSRAGDSSTRERARREVQDLLANADPKKLESMSKLEQPGSTSTASFSLVPTETCIRCKFHRRCSGLILSTNSIDSDDCAIQR
jgi:hypothetical protein